MTMRRGLWVVVLSVIVAGGCGTHYRAPVVDAAVEASAAAAPTVSAPVAGSEVTTIDSADVVVMPLPEDEFTTVALAEPDKHADEADVALNPAVIALLNQANLDTRGGRHDQAAASLERALQIEPQSAWLWHRLARTRLAQGQYELAQSLAARSNTYAEHDRRLLADNWALIAQARRLGGDTAGARAAELRVAEFADS